MKKIITSFALMAMMVSCSPERECGCGPAPVNANIAVVNADGQSLIDEVNFQQIKILYRHGGELFTGAYPVLVTDGPVNSVWIEMARGESAATYVDWNLEDRDTLTYQLVQGQPQIYVNGTLAAPDASGIIHLPK